MLVGRVIHDHVEHDLEAAPVSLIDEFLGHRDRAVLGGDVGVIGDVVSEVLLWAGEEG